MATTPEGTPYVESSDLVANYPAASLTLANRVDLVGVLPFATSTARGTAIPSPTDGQYTYLQDTNNTEFYNGTAWVSSSAMSLTASATLSSVTGVIIENCFSSAYRSYIISYRLQSTTVQGLNARLRVGGVSAAGANYENQFIAIDGTSITSGRFANQNQAFLGEIQNSNPSSGFVFMRDPFVASSTFFHISNISPYNSITMNSQAAIHTLYTSYTSIEIFMASGTVTGNIDVYGMRN